MASRGAKVKMTDTSFDDEDFISRLPDEILTHVLSYLTTKLSVSTSVLSKRWNRLWISVPNFDFDHDHAVLGCPVKKAHFFNFVDRFFSLKNVLSARKIKLNFYDSCEASRVATWINSIAMRNAEEIDLRLYCPQIHDLPDNFFSQSNLVELKLAFDFSEIPQSVYFPKLVTIHLGNVQFIHDDDNESMKNLMLGCPVLKSLYIQIDKWDDEQTLYICSSTLHLLEVDTRRCAKDFDNNVIIDALNLGEIHLLHHYGAGYEIVNVSSSVKLYLSFHGNDEMETEILTNLPILQNVNHLTLEVVWEEHWQRLPDLFHCTPNLVSFILLVANTGDPCFWYEPDDVPACFQSCLESVEITVCLNEGGAEELRMISYILKNAIVLKEFFVLVDSTVELEERNKFLEPLSTLPRASIACKVHK